MEITGTFVKNFIKDLVFSCQNVDRMSFQEFKNSKENILILPARLPSE